MSLLNDKTVYRDKNNGAGVAGITLATEMLPANIAAPDSWSITAGNGAGQWAIAAGVVSPAGAGVTPGTYNLTITAAWAAFPSPFNSQTGTLTIIVPGLSVYVDPAAGSDSNVGTKASPWEHAPGDPNATGNAAAHVPVADTLIVIKGGNTIRSNLVQVNTYCIYAGGDQAAGWGSGDTVYCGADQLGASSAASSGDVSNNPNVANIKKWTLGSARKLAQNLIDRDDDTLVFWAQWPEAGTDPYMNAADPHPSSGSGMHKYARSNITFNGASSTVTWPTGLVTAMGGYSLVGYYVGIWVSPNEVDYFLITSDDGVTGTFDCGTKTLQSNDPTAMQVVGHPRLITAVNQFAWSSDSLTVFAWTTSASNIEIMARKTGLDGSSAAAARCFALRIEGYYGDTSITEGVGVGISSTPDFQISCINTTIRWLVCGNLKGGGIRVSGSGDLNNSIIDGNYIYDSIRTSGIRLSVNNDTNTVRNNIINRIGRTGVYMFGPVDCVVSGNFLENIVSAHGNGYSFYNDDGTASGLSFFNNSAVNVARPLTKDGIPGGIFYDCVLEMDADQRDASRIYGSYTGETMDRMAFMRKRGVTGTGEDACALPSDSATRTYYLSGITGTFVAGETISWTGGSQVLSAYNATKGTIRLTSFSPSPTVGLLVTGGTSGATGTVAADDYSVDMDNCIFDGITGVRTDQTAVTDSLVTQVATNEFEIYDNVAPLSGNALASNTTVWDGSFTPQMKQYLGVGRMGDQFIYGIAVVDFTDIEDQPVSTAVVSGWELFTSDGTKTATITGGNISVADDAIGTGATTPSASQSVANGKYVQLSATTSASYSTTTEVEANFGEGNVFTWSITTALPSGWPKLLLTTDDQIRQTSGGSIGSSSPYATVFLAAWKRGTWGTTTVVGVSGGSFSIETLTTNKLRFKGKNAANIQLFEFEFNVSDTDAHDYIVSIDSSQSTSSAGVKVYVDNVSTAFTTNNWNTTELDRDIEWSKASNQYRMGWGYDGEIGCIYLHNEYLDITNSANRAKFSALQIGYDESAIFGVEPRFFITGPAAPINAGSNVQLGAGPAVSRVAGTVVDASGAAASWPSYTYSTAVSVTGPPTAQEGVTTGNYTVTLNNSVGASTIVSLSDAGGGTFSPSSLTFPPEVICTPQTFTYTPDSEGAKTITASSSGLIPGTVSVEVGPPDATAISLSAPSSSVVGEQFYLDVTLNGANPTGVTVEFDLTGSSATIELNPAVISIGESGVSLLVSPTSAGILSIAVTNLDGLSNPTPVEIAVSANSITGVSFGLQF